MTRGDKFIQDMTAKGLDEEQLRRFVKTGICLGVIGFNCADCPFCDRDCHSKSVAKYFRKEIKEETK